MKLGIVLMASGFSQRFGSNKLLHPVAGKPMVRHALETLASVREKLNPDIQVQIVVVSQYPEIIREALGMDMQAVDNPDSRQGISASIRHGLANLPADTEYYGFFVADQPLLQAADLESLIRQYLLSNQGIGCVSACGNPGNPVIFSRKYLPELLALQGDSGGKPIVLAHLSDTFQYPVEDSVLADIDHLEDIAYVSKFKNHQDRK